MENVKTIEFDPVREGWIVRSPSTGEEVLPGKCWPTINVALAVLEEAKQKDAESC